MPKGKKHYIAMAGMRGCLPNYCEIFPTKHGAVSALADLHDGIGHRALQKHGYVDLPKSAGNEYAQVELCTCTSADHRIE